MPDSNHQPGPPIAAAAVRMRPDLVFSAQQYARRRVWTVKDPLSLKYFHLGEEEYTILRLLDGRRGLAEIKQQFERQFAPLRLSLERLHAFLSRLHRDGLIVADAQGQGDQLFDRRGRRWRSEQLSRWSNVLAIRFRGIDPERLLDWLYPKLKFLFAPWSAAACVIVTLAALLLVTVQFQTFQTKLPEFQALASAGNLLWLMVALAVAKILHELGHALACKHFGGECHEIGIMLLVFTPCLYCNVSDAWMLPQKWRRIAVSAAGMGVEIVLASLATFVWWFSQPGLLNMLALNTMLVCSVSTVLFNGNPLLRFDGYYMLADLVETPNLWQRSRAVLRAAFAGWCLGLNAEPPDTIEPQRKFWLALYAVASIVYRWMVLVFILWFVSGRLAEYRLESITGLLVGLLLVGIIVPPLAAAVAFLKSPIRRRRVKRGRAALALAALGVLVALLFSIPAPVRLTAPVAIEPRDAQRVFVSVPGILKHAATAGERVEAGKPIAQLENLEIQGDLAGLRGQVMRHQEHVASLESRRARNPAAAAELPTARAALADVQAQLRQRERDEARLTLTSPAAGVVLPPPSIFAEQLPGKLRRWQGTPLEPQNAGSFLKTGSLFCLVGEPQQFEAVLAVDQADVELVEEGQRVRILLDLVPGRILHGRVANIAGMDAKILPRQFAGHEDVAAQTNRSGTSTPVNTLYQVRVTLDPPNQALLIGARGTAKILADSRPLGSQLVRYLRRTFSF